jgi:hypothetical protein
MRQRRLKAKQPWDVGLVYRSRPVERRLRRTEYAAEAEVSSEHLAAAPRHGMALVAHSPVARGRSALQRIGERHRKTAAQICLRWLVQQGVAAIPRTSKLERLSRTSRSSISSCRKRRCSRFPPWAAPAAG